MSRPSVAIFIYSGDVSPTMFTTAASPAERRQLDAWLTANPDLDALVSVAWRLAEAAGTGEPRDC